MLRTRHPPFQIMAKKIIHVFLTQKGYLPSEMNVIKVSCDNMTRIVLL